jgi:hypothetical protein
LAALAIKKSIFLSLSKNLKVNLEIVGSTSHNHAKSQRGILFWFVLDKKNGEYDTLLRFENGG